VLSADHVVCMLCDSDSPLMQTTSSHFHFIFLEKDATLLYMAILSFFVWVVSGQKYLFSARMKSKPNLKVFWPSSRGQPFHAGVKVPRSLNDPCSLSLSVLQMTLLVSRHQRALQSPSIWFNLAVERRGAVKSYSENISTWLRLTKYKFHQSSE